MGKATKIARLGVKPHQLHAATAMYICTRPNGSIDWPRFCDLAGYSSIESAKTSMRKISKQLQALAETVGPRLDAEDAADAAADPSGANKRKSDAPDDAALKKKPRGRGVAKQRKDMAAALEAEEPGQIVQEQVASQAPVMVVEDQVNHQVQAQSQSEAQIQVTPPPPPPTATYNGHDAGVEDIGYSEAPTPMAQHQTASSQPVIETPMEMEEEMTDDEV